MDLQRLANSRQVGKIALGLSRILPLRQGRSLAHFIADRFAAHRGTPLVQAIRANHWVIRGGGCSSEQLDMATHDTLRHVAYSYYMLFHYLDNPVGLQKRVRFSPQAETIIERSRQARHGLIVAGVHMGNFDLVAQAAALHGLRAFALSLPQPGETVEWQHRFRRQAGLEILDASVANLHQAIKRLRAGETMLTGIDHPLPDARYRPSFFGRPACVPVHYVSLALKSSAPIVVMASIYRPDGIYDILSSEMIDLKPDTDRRLEVMNNAEMLLEIAAEFIRQAPEQWTVFQPAWPEALLEMP
ncbi:MAG: hypothetical protein JXA78_03010 [Anaerolineales bacterium]|nr:hypothetical protein [Anaerolineales bacterium]